MKRAIVLCGVSGTGKTHARLNAPELKDLPHVDVADYYRECPGLDWVSATAAVCRRARELLEEHGVVVIEGYYLPGSPSRMMLQADMTVAGAKVEFHEFWAPMETCIERIRRQWERGEISAADCQVRIEMLGRCWRPQ